MSDLVIDEPRASRPSRERFARAVQIVLGVVFLIAGIGKASDPSELTRVLEFDHVPESFRGAVLLLVVGAEIVLGQSLILGWGGRRILWATTTLLAVYIVQIVALLSSVHAPRCSCLQLVEAYQSARTSHISGLVRNALMFVALCFLLRRRKFVDGSAPTA
jgi:uncharacterized membrane protein YphA (DoxX/SURF4 family)